MKGNGDITMSQLSAAKSFCADACMCTLYTLFQEKTSSSC